SEDVVHCDLKPADIMIEPVAGQEDFIKVLDFGIAKVKGPAQEVGPHTQQGDLVGTFDYMSPEQIMREDVDGRADVWSLGVIMHEMISGERIFYADDGAEIIGRVMRSEIPPPSEFNPDVPEALEAVIMGALQRELEERYDSAAEMRERVAEAEDLMRRSGQIGAGQAGEVGVSESVDQADAVGEELETGGRRRRWSSRGTRRPKTPVSCPRTCSALEAPKSRCSATSGRRQWSR
ncbi:MAG: serine/threonine-protein kinase, partial [Bradymonadaceae bacterium]